MDNFTIASFLHLFMRVCLVGGLVFFMIAAGEKALGFSLRKIIDAIEKEADAGRVWPATALLIVSIFAMAFVLG